MNKKIVTLVILSIFLLTGISTIAIAEKTELNINENTGNDNYATVTGFIYGQDGEPIKIDGDGYYFNLWVFDTCSGFHIQIDQENPVDENGYYELKVEKNLPTTAFVYAELVYQHLFLFHIYKPSLPKDGYYVIEDMQPGMMYTLEPFLIDFTKSRCIQHNNIFSKILGLFPTLQLLLNR
jgi:hypothetical protein